MISVPAIRVQTCNEAPIRIDGDFVLYWMVAFRRTTWNFSLQRAVEWAKDLKKPLVIFEPLRIGYRWASDRLHRFVLDGMADNLRQLEPLRGHGVYYYPYVEAAPDQGKGLLASLAGHACVVVTDEYPSFFLPRMVRAAAQQLSVRQEQVDSNGLLPLRAADRVFASALAFRSFLQKELRPHLEAFPRPDPLASVRLPPRCSLPAGIVRQWPAANVPLLKGNPRVLARLAIDHTVRPVGYRGGSVPARTGLRQFLGRKLRAYAAQANHPDDDVRSSLSPYLHFGHLSAHEVFFELARQEDWSPAEISSRSGGRREGWWGMSPSAAAFLDQFVTWRELGYNMSSHRDDHDRFESLPAWARATLARHASDPRPHVYTLDEFESGRTHDPLWNAAQAQLVREGRIHNYLRMLWGKKILEWTAGPEDALAVMIELNNKYAVDGRDPNSYSGIFWVLGRYDRPWGPDRPIFGTVRYMTSQSTIRKLRLREYLVEFGSGGQPEDRKRINVRG
ncbi:MAG: deoxyribodipyrimidine photolyase [Planctomycetes bacterium]|nr:deoxyribodipyrimidine photolyase [Planctomycetota bacterium]